MNKTLKGENVVWLLTDVNPWGGHGAAPLEDGQLRDEWEYHIKEPRLANDQPSGWYVAAVDHAHPEYKPNPANPDAEYTNYRFPLNVAFKTIEEARASAYGFYCALRLFPGFPDVRDIIGEVTDTVSDI